MHKPAAPTTMPSPSSPFLLSGTTIPTELLFHVVSFLSGDDDGPTLARLARCSYRAHQIAIPALYHHIHIHSELAFTRLLDNLAVRADDSGSPTTDIPVEIGFCDERQTATATRKLAQFLLVHHITLHFLPRESTFQTICEQVEHADFTELRLRDTTVQHGSDRLVLCGTLFPNVCGVTFGKEFILQVYNSISHHHLQPCEDMSACSPPASRKCGFLDGVLEQRVSPILRHLVGFLRIALPGIKCWNIDDMPTGLCPLLQKDLATALFSSRVWPQYSSPELSITHSTFPQSPLRRGCNSGGPGGISSL